MTITDADLHFDYGYPESTATVRTPAGDLYKVTLINDIDAGAPDGDYGLPTFILEAGNYWGGGTCWGGVTLFDVRDNHHTTYGSHAMRHDGMTRTLGEVFDHFYERAESTDDALSMTRRWLEVFHNGGLVVTITHPHRERVVLVSYWTERMVLDAFGFTTETLPGPDAWDTEHNEWVAYAEGEVYGVAVEVDTNPAWSDEDDADWEAVEGPVFGYYGEQYAVEEAVSLINSHARPLGGLRMAV